LTIVIDKDKEAKELHLKRLEELLKQQDETRIEYPDGRIYDGKGNVIAEEPSYDQMAWFNRRMKGPKRSWEMWDQ
jgi:hypothetical protein